MTDSMARWRSRAVALGKVGRGGRYPAAMREEAVALARAHQAGGGTVDGFAKALGVACSTLNSWLASRKPKIAEVLLPVTMRAEGVEAHVRLELGCAHAQLSLGQLAELVRKLS